MKYENLEDAVVTALFKLKPPKLHQALSDPGNPQSKVNSHKMIAGLARPINSKKRIGLIERNCNEQILGRASFHTVCLKVLVNKNLKNEAIA